MATVLLSSCVHGPASLNVRVVNFTPVAIRVESEGGEAAEKVQVVNPGGTALDYAPVLIVHGPKTTTRVAAGPLSQMTDGAGYRYAHVVRSGIGGNDVVFEVSIDEEGRVWARSPAGARIPFPAEVVAR